jgi:PAS domain S-box-containing protein
MSVPRKSAGITKIMDVGAVAGNAEQKNSTIGTDARITFEGYQAILDAAEEAIVITDSSEAVLFANSAYKRLFGGESIPLRMPPDIEPENTTEALFRRSIPLPGDFGKGVLVCHFFYRASELSSVEESYRLLVENSLQGILVLTAQKILFTNRALSDICGYPMPEMYLFTPQDIVDKVVYPDDRERINGYMQERFAGNEVINHYEFRIFRRDGVVRWLEIFTSMIDYRGERAVQAALIDITSRKEAAEELAIRERKFTTLAEHLPDLIARFDRFNRVLFMNRAVEIATGYSVNECMGRTLAENHVPAAISAFWEQQFQYVLNTGQEKTITAGFTTLHGFRHFHIRFVPETDSNGYVESVLCVARDITDVRDAEEELRKTRANLEEAYRIARLGTWEYTVRTRTLFLSPEIYSILGIDPVNGGFPAERFREMLYPGDRALFVDFDQEYWKSHSSATIEHRIIRRDGEVRWILVRGNIAGYLRETPARLIGSLQDITDRKSAEEALQRSEERYRELVENITDIIFTVSSDLVVTFVSPGLRASIGYSPAEIVGKSIWELVPAEDRTMIRGFLADIDAGRSVTAELRLVAKDGSYHWISGNTHPVLKGGLITGFQGTFSDITARKQAEEYRRYKELFDNVADGVFILDSGFKLLVANGMLEAQTGVPRESLLNTDFRRFLPAEGRERFAAVFDFTGNNSAMQFEIEIWDAVGKPRLLAINARPVRYLGSDSYLCVSRDITETRMLQDKLILSERLAATGQLAASVAHEINSPLQAITVLLDIMGRGIDGKTEYRENIKLLKQSFSSIRDTVKHLLDLNRPGNQRRQPIDICSIIEKTVALAQSNLNQHNIRIILKCPHNVPRIKASPQQLSQVFLNLINNSIEAIASLPEDTIGQRYPREIRISGRIVGLSVVIRVADTGPGISADALRHVFEPFFTRNKHMGMGIGLSVCHQIIHNHGGTITVKNGIRGGAIFTIMLPL